MTAIAPIEKRAIPATSAGLYQARKINANSKPTQPSVNCP